MGDTIIRRVHRVRPVTQLEPGAAWSYLALLATLARSGELKINPRYSGNLLSIWVNNSTEEARTHLVPSAAGEAELEEAAERLSVEFAEHAIAHARGPEPYAFIPPCHCGAAAGEFCRPMHAGERSQGRWTHPGRGVEYARTERTVGGVDLDHWARSIADSPAMVAAPACQSLVAMIAEGYLRTVYLQELLNYLDTTTGDRLDQIALDRSLGRMVVTDYDGSLREETDAELRGRLLDATRGPDLARTEQALAGRDFVILHNYVGTINIGDPVVLDDSHDAVRRAVFGERVYGHVLELRTSNSADLALVRTTSW